MHKNLGKMLKSRQDVENLKNQIQIAAKQATKFLKQRKNMFSMQVTLKLNLLCLFFSFLYGH